MLIDAPVSVRQVSRIGRAASHPPANDLLGTQSSPREHTRSPTLARRRRTAGASPLSEMSHRLKPGPRRRNADLPLEAEGVCPVRRKIFKRVSENSILGVSQLVCRRRVQAGVRTDDMKPIKLRLTEAGGQSR
jgi:hypothetical protein